MIDIAIPRDSNIKKKHEKFEKCQGLRNEVEKLWDLKATLVIGALWALTPADPGSNIRNLCPGERSSILH